MNIHIYKGPIRSGKTTQLQEFCNSRKGTAGILTPVIEGRRCFLNIETNEMFAMEAQEGEQNTIDIGKYHFSISSFYKANQLLVNCITNNQSLIVIDEIGPLELQEKGFSKTLKHFLSLPDIYPDLLLVVRDTLLKEIENYFQLNSLNTIVITDLNDFTLH